MKPIKILFSIAFIGIAFSTCKKDPSPDAGSDAKVFTFSTDKCIATPDNGFLLTGSSYPNYHISKVDNNGSLVWKKDNYYADYVFPTNNNGCISCADSSYYDYVNAKYYYGIVLNKLDSRGNIMYSKKFFKNDSGAVYYPKVVELSSGDIMVIGVDDYYDFCAFKADKNGNLLWVRSTTPYLYVSAINKMMEINTNGDIIIIADAYKAYYAKMDSSGTLLWEKSKVIGKWLDEPTDIHKLNNNEYIITGYYDAAPDYNYNYQFFAYKINGLGDSLGYIATGGSKQDICLSSALDQNNNITLVGMEGRDINDNYLNFSSVRAVTFNPFLTSVIRDKTYAQIQDCAGMSGVYNSDGSFSIIGKKLAYGNPAIKHTFFMKTKPDGSL
jgi:hypothetical protein